MKVNEVKDCVGKGRGERSEVGWAIWWPDLEHRGGSPGRCRDTPPQSPAQSWMVRSCPGWSRWCEVKTKEEENSTGYSLFSEMYPTIIVIVPSLHLSIDPNLKYLKCETFIKRNWLTNTSIHFPKYPDSCAWIYSLHVSEWRIKRVRGIGATVVWGETNDPQAIDGNSAVEVMDVFLPPAPSLRIGEVREGGGARPHLIGPLRREGGIKSRNKEKEVRWCC